MTKGAEKMRRYEEAMKRGEIPIGSVSGSGKIHIPDIGDIHIAGSGRVSPEEINVSGSCRLPGGLRIGSLKASGSMRVDGAIEAEEIRISGSASIGGEVRASNIFTSGSFKAAGRVVGKRIHFVGSSRIGEEIHSEGNLTAHGYLSVGGDLRTEGTVELRGRFEIDGKLTAERFKGEIRGKSRIEGGIEADYVEILREEGEIRLFRLPIPIWKGRGRRLTTTDIIGKKRVHIEYVTCTNITGGDVYIGEGCEVKGRVRYWGNLEIHPEASLKNPPEKIKSISNTRIVCKDDPRLPPTSGG